MQLFWVLGSTRRMYGAGVSAQDDLWVALREWFEVDDGSLPEVVFSDLPRGVLPALLGFLMERSAPDSTQPLILWDTALSAAAPIEPLTAAARVASGEIPNFHVRIQGIEVDGIALPSLGIFVCTDELALDYRMGGEWTPAVLAAFVRLLGAMHALAPAARLESRGDTDMPADPWFQPAVERYLSSSDANQQCE
jgi:hypothetical protein